MIQKQRRLFRATVLGLVTVTILAVVAMPFQAFAAAQQYDWQNTSVGLGGDSRDWYATASSADGTKLVAAGYLTGLYTSNDSGATWTERTALGTKDWKALTSSADGSRIVAAAGDNSVYTSADFGATWTDRTTAAELKTTNFTFGRFLDSSADGSKIVMASGSTWNSEIRISSDYGATWSTIARQHWGEIAITADGTKIATVLGDTVSISTDDGASWTDVYPRSAAPHIYTHMAMSDDGMSLIVSADLIMNDIDANNEVVVSKDGGQTWSVQPIDDPNAIWSGVGVSGDGETFVVYGSPGEPGRKGIYISTDGAMTWSNPTPLFPLTVSLNYDGTKIVADTRASFLGGPLYTSADSGANWTERLTGLTFSDIASSDDGKKLVATVRGSGHMYMSTDYGLTWTLTNVSEASEWNSVASSADGTKLVAVSGSEGIMTSNDSGATWEWQITNTITGWSSVTSSADGTKLAAVTDGGAIYTSTDSGATWTEQTAAGTRAWQDIASSDDGAKLVAVADGGAVYTSTNAGVTWTARSGAGTRAWKSVASNADGTKLAAIVDGGAIYTSTDSGATWTEQTAAGTRAWQSISSSDDGVVLVAVADYVYVSTDSGVTWTAQTDSDAGERTWSAVTTNADGTRFAALVNPGVVYLGIGTRNTPTDTGTPSTPTDDTPMANKGGDDSLAETGISTVWLAIGAIGLLAVGASALALVSRQQGFRS